MECPVCVEQDSEGKLKLVVQMVFEYTHNGFLTNVPNLSVTERVKGKSSRVINLVGSSSNSNNNSSYRVI